MTVDIKALVGLFICEFLFFTLPLFLASGTLAWPAAWIFLILSFGFGLALTLWLFRYNPGLLKERMTITKRDQKAWDKVWMSLMGTVFLVWLVLMPLDAVRFHWSQVPLFLQVAGAIIILYSFYLSYAVFRENSYLSPMARIQRDRGQTVVSTGPYHYVRHPLYAAASDLSARNGPLVGLLVRIALGTDPSGRHVCRTGNTRGTHVKGRVGRL